MTTMLLPRGSKATDVAAGGGDMNVISFCTRNACFHIKRTEWSSHINLPGNWTLRKVLDLLNDITVNVVILKREIFPPDVDKR